MCNHFLICLTTPCNVILMIFLNCFTKIFTFFNCGRCNWFSITSEIPIKIKQKIYFLFFCYLIDWEQPASTYPKANAKKAPWSIRKLIGCSFGSTLSNRKTYMDQILRLPFNKEKKWNRTVSAAVDGCFHQYLFVNFLHSFDSISAFVHTQHWSFFLKFLPRIDASI